MYITLVFVINHFHAGGQIAVLAFSTTDRDSFDAIPSWKDKVFKEANFRKVQDIQDMIKFKSYDMVFLT